MSEQRFRPAWAEVDLVALADNVRAIRAVAGPAAVCAVVKADGYGHGALAVSEAVLEAGATSLAVALVEEGLELRQGGIAAPVLLLSECPPGAAGDVVANSLTPTVYTAGGIDALATAAAGRSGSGPIGVHLKVDTGMHRVGVDVEQAGDLACRIDAHPSLRLDAVWTHFAAADDSSRQAFTNEQLRRFNAACRVIEAAGVPVPLRHTANSAATLASRGAHFDLVRPGIVLYGYGPHPHPDLELRPVLALKARVSHIRNLAAGERVSYGLRYELPESSVIATVPLGYADGVPRRLSSTGATVIVGGQQRPIAGTITMDQLLVDCGPGAQIAVGDEVVLLGRQGEASVSADDWAARLETISYEILCAIGPRVPRVYLR